MHHSVNLVLFYTIVSSVYTQTTSVTVGVGWLPRSAFATSCEPILAFNRYWRALFYVGFRTFSNFGVVD